jgi:multimeric flavodoxin WrbA
VRAIAINGSPRKDWNTATLLRKALEGAESEGAETRLVHLYDLAFKGCTSCFSCKMKMNTCGGLCAMKDDLRDILRETLESDVLLLGSPIYFFDVTGEMRSFLERLLFANLVYDLEKRTVFEREISCGFIFTMNVPEEAAERFACDAIFERHAAMLRILNADSEILAAYDTYQFPDYSMVHAPMFDETRKARARAERYPVDCQRAFEMGARLAAARK